MERCTDKNGRYIILKVKINEVEHCMANVYIPNIDDSKIFQDLLNDVEAMNTDLKIIGGDFNLVLDKTIDKKGAWAGHYA